jgi:hypothetical protein
MYSKTLRQQAVNEPSFHRDGQRKILGIEDVPVGADSVYHSSPVRQKAR